MASPNLSGREQLQQTLESAAGDRNILFDTVEAVSKHMCEHLETLTNFDLLRAVVIKCWNGNHSGFWYQRAHLLWEDEMETRKAKNKKKRKK